MEHNEILIRLQAAIEELEQVSGKGHAERKHLVVAVELILDAMHKLQEPKEGDADGTAPEAE